jgi:hypothetical protein
LRLKAPLSRPPHHAACLFTCTARPHTAWQKRAQRAWRTFSGLISFSLADASFLLFLLLLFLYFSFTTLAKVSILNTTNVKKFLHFGNAKIKVLFVN